MIICRSDKGIYSFWSPKHDNFQKNIDFFTVFLKNLEIDDKIGLRLHSVQNFLKNVNKKIKASPSYSRSARRLQRT